MKVFVYFLALLTPALSIEASPLDNEKILTFENTNCQSNDTCDLSEVKFKSENYQVKVHGDLYQGTRLFAEYKTANLPALEKYGFVQFIKGCHFSSKVINGKVQKELAYSRHFFGGTIAYTHPTFVIDSVDMDPFYNSDREPDQNGFDLDILKYRYLLYRWNTVPGSFDKKTQKYYGREKPITPSLYVTDYPGVANFSSSTREAHNISLKLKMCVYKTDEIPLQLKPEEINFATPITCFDWSSSFIYDHENEKFEAKAEIDPFCEDNLPL